MFLGNGKYFVTSDVGGGKMQWYGFHREPAGGTALGAVSVVAKLIRIWPIETILQSQEVQSASTDFSLFRFTSGGTNQEGKKGSNLLGIFGNWCDGVVDLIRATPEEDILRRDIYDRPPIFTWSNGRVVLLGDSAHAMQPNMGQGGCMAIEDGHQLAIDLSKALIDAEGEAEVPKKLIVCMHMNWVRFPNASLQRSLFSLRIVVPTV